MIRREAVELYESTGLVLSNLAGGINSTANRRAEALIPNAADRARNAYIIVFNLYSS